MRRAGQNDVMVLNSILIEPATLEDGHAIAELHVLTWRAVYQGIVPDEYLATLSIEKREAFWRESIVKGTPELRVARIEGRTHAQSGSTLLRGSRQTYRRPKKSRSAASR